MFNPYVILAAILITIVIGTGGYIKGGNDRETAVRNELAAHERDALAEQVEKFKQGDSQHAKDQEIIARLTADAHRLRTHFPTCPKPGQTIPNTDGAAGVVSTGVDEVFGRFQQRVEQIIERCERLNADARQSNSVTQ